MVTFDVLSACYTRRARDLRYRTLASTSNGLHMRVQIAMFVLLDALA